SLRFTSFLMGSPVCLLSNSRISSTEWKSSSAWRGVILTSSFDDSSFCAWAGGGIGLGSCVGEDWAAGADRPAGYSTALPAGGAFCALEGSGAHMAAASTAPKSHRTIPAPRSLPLFIEIEFIRFRIVGNDDYAEG